MVKLLSIKNILYCIVLIFMATALLITCEWTSEVSTNISKESTKSPKASAERFGEIEEKKIDYSDKVQQVQISQTKVNSEIYRVTDSITKSNELIILDFKVKPGETLSSILTPINGVPYSTILKISETSISGLNFNLFDVGQKYQLVLNPLDSTLISYTHSFSKEKIIEVILNPNLVIKKVSQIKRPKTIKYNPAKSNLNSKIKKVKTIKNDKNVTKLFLLGKTNLSTNSIFVKLENKYHTKSKMYLEKQTAVSFKKMKSAAEKDGIIIITCPRNNN